MAGARPRQPFRLTEAWEEAKHPRIPKGSIFGGRFVSGVTVPLTRAEVWDFSSGQCHALALALHDRTGWPIYGAGWDDEGPHGEPEHIFVSPQKDIGLDATGLFRRDAGKGDPAKDPDRSGQADWKPINPDYLAEQRGEFEDWERPDLAHASKIAPRVLHQAGYGAGGQLPADPHDYLIRRLGLREEGRWFVAPGGARLRLALSHDRSEMILHEILAQPRGSGLGTAVVEALGDYADATGKGLVVEDVRNRAFFERFDWLTADDEAGQFTYFPEVLSETWRPSLHPRGRTTPGTNEGSFAPRPGAGARALVTDEATLREVFSFDWTDRQGAHWRATPTAITISRVNDAQLASATVEVDITRDDTKVGAATRMTYFDDNGRVVVANEEMHIADQGSGFGGANVRTTLERAFDRGAQRAVVAATWPGGGYAWARAGFLLAPLDEDLTPADWTPQITAASQQEALQDLFDSAHKLLSGVNLMDFPAEDRAERLFAREHPDRDWYTIPDVEANAYRKRVSSTPPPPWPPGLEEELAALEEAIAEGRVATPAEVAAWHHDGPTFTWPYDWDDEWKRVDRKEPMSAAKILLRASTWGGVMFAPR